MNNEIEQYARQIASQRVQKTLHWMRVQGEVPDDNVARALIAAGVWRSTGKKLSDWLVGDCGISGERAIELTIEAVNGGFDDASVYGVE